MIETRTVTRENSEILDPAVECLREGIAVKFKPKGSSMYPFIRERTDYVILNQLNPNAIKKNQIVLYKRENGQYVLHRIVRVNDTSVDLRGDAQRVVEKNIPFTAILAEATLIIRNGKEIKTNDISQKLAFFAWSLLLPIRGRLVRWIKKVLNG